MRIKPKKGEGLDGREDINSPNESLKTGKAHKDWYFEGYQGKTRGNPHPSPQRTSGKSKKTR